MNIAQPLFALLKSRDISRSKLAREIGVHTSTVSNWLDGKDVKPDNLSALCSYFECSLDYFAQKEKPIVPTSDEQIDSNIQKLLDSVSDFSESEMAILFEQIKKIKNIRI